jgi:hypothetical protein
MATAMVPEISHKSYGSSVVRQIAPRDPFVNGPASFLTALAGSGATGKQAKSLKGSGKGSAEGEAERVS